MKTKQLFGFRKMAVVAACGVLFSMQGQAGSIGTAGQVGRSPGKKECLSVTVRPLSEFLSAQGTWKDAPQFFPPVKDYGGWGDNPATTFALVDYAGLANQYIKSQTGRSLGTQLSGSVIECKVSRDQSKVTVGLVAMKALVFTESIGELIGNGFDFAGASATFGSKAVEVANGKSPVLGTAVLVTTFTITPPGGKLPDLLNVINDSVNYAPANLTFAATASGTCSSGIYAGTKATLNVNQVAATDAKKSLIFTKEIVKVTDADGGNCGN